MVDFDFLLRFENLHELVETMKATYDIELDLPHLNQGSGSPDRPVITSRSKLLIEAYYAQDMDLYESV